MDRERAPHCLSCRHFFVTWDQHFPRGCRVFGIKSKELPSVEVHRATGLHCPVYKKSDKIKDRDDNGGWYA